MNIIPSRPIKTQQFNKKTATGLVADAVLGHITLTIQLTNEDMTHQYIDQSFLILRDTFTLDQPLLSRDFLKTNNVKLGSEHVYFYQFYIKKKYSTHEHLVQTGK